MGNRGVEALLCGGFVLAVVVAGCGPRRGDRAHREDGAASCTPGTAVVVACDNEGLGVCTGDPKLRVCDGATSVAGCWAGEGELGEDDDGGGGLCPRATVTCPASGSLTVVTTDFGSEYGAPEDAYACNWQVGSGGAPPLDAGP